MFFKTIFTYSYTKIHKEPYIYFETYIQCCFSFLWACYLAQFTDNPLLFAKSLF